MTNDTRENTTAIRELREEVIQLRIEMAKLQEQIKPMPTLISKLDDTENAVTKMNEQFQPIRKYVFMILSLLITGIITAILANVIK
jgi:uncharacterized coiled-coil protein SlyX